MTKTVEWEHVTICTQRFRVPGGWLVKIWNAEGIALTFFPDVYHQWELT